MRRNPFAARRERREWATSEDAARLSRADLGSRSACRPKAGCATARRESQRVASIPCVGAAAVEGPNHATLRYFLCPYPLHDRRRRRVLERDGHSGRNTRRRRAGQRLRRRRVQHGLGPERLDGSRRRLRGQGQRERVRDLLPDEPPAGREDLHRGGHRLRLRYGRRRPVRNRVQDDPLRGPAVESRSGVQHVPRRRGEGGRSVLRQHHLGV